MFLKKKVGTYVGEVLLIYGIFFMHINQFLTEKMESDTKFRRHIIDPYIYIYICLCVCVYVCMYVCIYIYILYIYIYNIYIHTHTTPTHF